MVIAATDASEHDLHFIPYLQTTGVVLVAKRNPKGLNAVQITNLCGHTIAVQTGTQEAVQLQEENKKCGKQMVVKEYLLASDAIDDLLNGTAEAIYQDASFGQYYLQQYQNDIEQLQAFSLPPQGLLVNGSTFFAVQEAFSQMRQDRTYDNLLTSWNLTKERVDHA